MEYATYTLHTRGHVQITITAPRNSIIVEARLIWDAFPPEHWQSARP